MSDSSPSGRPGLSRGWWLALLIVPALIIFSITWFSITNSRSDSLALLRSQGKSFTSALARASENAITAESFYDRLVQARYHDLASMLAEVELSGVTELDLLRFAQSHNLYGAHIFGIDSNLVAGTSLRGQIGDLPGFVHEELGHLIANQELRYMLLLDESDEHGSAVHYYLELANQLDRVVLLVINADYYRLAEDQIGIGYLAQDMAGERGVEYIIYQAQEGIIFASRKISALPAIDSDPFLQNALESDTIVSRLTELEGKEVLELVSPFATDEYPIGVFRVGLSLDQYHVIVRSSDTQMILLSAFLMLLVGLALVFVSSRQKRKEISRRYSQIKSMTDQLFEQMRTGIAVIAPDQSFRMTNQAFEKIVGVRNINGRKFSEIISRDLLDLSNLNLSGNLPVEDIELLLDLDSGPKHVLLAISSISYDSARQAECLLVAYDVTRLREAEQRAARKERLTEMGDLAAGVAHEIRNPLNTISIAIQRLASEFSPEQRREEFESFTTRIRNETRRLNDIITKFLALAHESGNRNVWLDLTGFLSEMIAMLNEEANSLGIELELVTESKAEIMANADELKQVIHNLFNNAKEALEGEAGRIRIRLSKTDARVLLEFSDSGPGLNEEIAQQAMAPYFTTKEGGTGLGLPTVHRIISGFGGEVSIGESELGGALIRLSFPHPDQSQ